MSPDFVPLSMEIHGDMARDTPIDDIVLVEQGRGVKGSWNSQKSRKRSADRFSEPKSERKIRLGLNAPT